METLYKLGKVIYKAGQIVWENKKEYRVVFYPSFGFSLQRWSMTNEKWDSQTFSRDVNAFKQTDYM